MTERLETSTLVDTAARDLQGMATALDRVFESHGCEVGIGAKGERVLFYIKLRGTSKLHYCSTWRELIRCYNDLVKPKLRVYIEGPVGSGKSAFIRHMMAVLKEEYEVMLAKSKRQESEGYPTETLWVRKKGDIE